MTSPTPIPPPQKAAPSPILNLAAACWLTVATIGQWMFGLYILLFYGKSAVSNDFQKWNRVLPHGYVHGDWKGNLVVGLHILAASILVFGGPLQLLPAVRRHLPVFHRLLGRTYVLTAVLVSAAGLVMAWTRQVVGDRTQQVSISIQAVYIICFALLSVHYARSGQFGRHRAWTLRLFLVVSGVWFFRVGLMFWLVVNGGPVGFDPDTFTGPFLTALALLTYAFPVPLAVLELYLYAGRRQTRPLVVFTAAVLFSSAVLMAIGIFGAAMGMWLPRL